MKPHDQQKLEQFIHHTLRNLPDRKAPHTLEARVHAAIVARQARPWWRQSFAHWPLPVRAAFCAFAVAIAAAFVIGSTIGMANVLPLLRELSTPLLQARAAYHFVAELGQSLFRTIPTLWLYGFVAALGALYAALFGLGATAYRTIILNR